MTLGIYIQVPFCQTKCTYCNFKTGVFSKDLYEPYVNAVCCEIRDHASLHAGAGFASRDVAAGFSRAHSGSWEESAALTPDALTVDTVYIGGGTPSLFAPEGLARMVAAVRSAFRCQLEEVTLEADPETVTAEKSASWREAGINRISFGAQSFHDNELKAAGRLHRRDDIYAATRLLRDAGFTNLSFDLIAGLPHQTAASWESSLDQLLDLRPEHVSIYLLEIDEDSRLGREIISLGGRYSARAVPSEGEMAAFYERACERLAAAGFEHYEISNWALVGGRSFSSDSPALPLCAGASAPEADFRSKHNLKYWRREPYFGFGAGAHSFDGSSRWANVHDPTAYVQAIAQGRLPMEQEERLTPQQHLEEELFLGLRMLEGIDCADIEQRYNVSLAPRLERLRDEGLVEICGTRVRLAPSRLTISNEVFIELMA